MLLSACGPKPVQSIQDPALAKLASEARELALTWLDDSQRSDFFEVRTNYKNGVAAVLESRAIRVAPAAHKASCQPMNGGMVAAFAISYGFASRNILAGFLSSYYSKRHYKEGQVLEIDGKKGTIVSLDNVSITLDMEDRQVIIPVHKVLSENVTIYK